MIVFLSIASLAATALIWRQILRSQRSWSAKLFHAAFAAIPILGPMLYIFLVPPAPHPLDDQMPPFPKGTQPYPSFTPLVKSFNRTFRGKRRHRR